MPADPMPADPSSRPSIDVALHRERADVVIDQLATLAVVRRRVVEERQTLEVVVRREVLEVEHVPLEDAADRVVGEPQPPLVVVLSQEVPVVHLEVRPYEQVTLEVKAVTTEQEVTVVLGTEHAEVVSTAPITPP